MPTEVRRLHEREHLSKKHIAERLGMSRTTVHRLLELAEPPRYERPKRTSLVDGYVESVKAMLAEDPAVPATVMLEHLRRGGYRRGVSILKDLWQTCARSTGRVLTPSSARPTSRAISVSSTGATCHRISLSR